LRLLHLHIQNFRRHDSIQLHPTAGVNLLYGKNGVGKTNILEAIHFICFTKSLIDASDSECLKLGTSHFELDAVMESDTQIQSSVRVYYSALEGKNVFINKSALSTFSSIIGEYPCVGISPFDIALAQGSPQERRRFLDMSIAQTNKAYLQDLQSYNRILKQRNKILFEMKTALTSSSNGTLEAYTQSLIKVAAAIVFKRVKFTEEFQSYVTKAYHLFHSFDETPSLKYESDFEIDIAVNEQMIASSMEAKFQRIEPDEIRRGQTLSGPHRDDIEFLINAISLKKFASQGQQKTFVICLKLAQHAYIEERLNEKPLFLLDDVFSELDRNRVGDLIELLKPLGQALITTTEQKDFSEVNQIAIT
jgi:DNA replication and repair protein RecF